MKFLKRAPSWLTKPKIQHESFCMKKKKKTDYKSLRISLKSYVELYRTMLSVCNFGRNQFDAKYFWKTDLLDIVSLNQVDRESATEMIDPVEFLVG